MKLKRNFRIAGRVAWLAFELLLAAVRYLFQCTFRAEEFRLAARAAWLHHICRRLLAVFNLRLEVSGPIPRRCLLVSNHLGYLDIIVLGSLTPVVFVAKSEVAGWPVFGWFARLGGTIFVNRQKRTEVGRTTGEIGAALASEVVLVLFPEGTSSGGETVLPFKSSLLEPATGQTQPLAAGCIGYFLAEGDAGEEVCYWRDMTLVPHLLNLLGKREVMARVGFTEFKTHSSDRKVLAQELHAEVLRLKNRSQA